MTKTHEKQLQLGIRAGREAASGAIQYGYMSWLARQVAQCRALSHLSPYSEGYVIGANDVLAISSQKQFMGVAKQD